MAFISIGWIYSIMNSYENADVTFMEILSIAVPSMSFPCPGREGGLLGIPFFQLLGSQPAEGPGLVWVRGEAGEVLGHR